MAVELAKDGAFYYNATDETSVSVFGRAFKWARSRVRSVFTRAITSLPWLGSSRPMHEAQAMSLVPVWACVRILADTISSLPVELFRRNLDGTTSKSSFIPDLLFAPAAVDDLVQWLHKCVVSLALRGNAYGYVTERDSLGFPTMVEWLNPDEMYVDELHPTMPRYFWQGSEVPASDIVHIRWVVLPGRVVGLSPVQAFAHTIGVGIKAAEYGAAWFDNGGVPPSVLKNSAKTINPQDASEISDRLSASIRSGRPLVIGQDWDFTALSVSPGESQFLETMKMNATQIAAIYGVPPTLVGGEPGGTFTYTSVEMEVNGLATLTLRPWLVRIENAISRLMPGREYVKFNVDAMIRTSIIDRYTAHGMALAQGWRNRDEIRELENLPPLPDGIGKQYPPAAGSAPALPAAQTDNSTEVPPSGE